jgi:hypothetical protein
VAVEAAEVLAATVCDTTEQQVDLVVVGLFLDQVTVAAHQMRLILDGPLLQMLVLAIQEVVEVEAVVREQLSAAHLQMVQSVLLSLVMQSVAVAAAG